MPESIYDISAEGTGALDTGTHGSVVDFVAMADNFWVQYQVYAGACWFLGWHARSNKGSALGADIVVYIADVTTVGILTGNQSNITDNDISFLRVNNDNVNRLVILTRPIRINNALWIGAELGDAAGTAFVSVFWGK